MGRDGVLRHQSTARLRRRREDGLDWRRRSRPRAQFLFWVLLRVRPNSEGALRQIGWPSFPGSCACQRLGVSVPLQILCFSWRPRSWPGWTNGPSAASKYLRTRWHLGTLPSNFCLYLCPRSAGACALLLRDFLHSLGSPAGGHLRTLTPGPAEGHMFGDQTGALFRSQVGARVRDRGAMISPGPLLWCRGGSLGGGPGWGPGSGAQSWLRRQDHSWAGIGIPNIICFAP